MAIDAAKVREVRERTGLPMMECKKALETADGDTETAIENLRKSGAKAKEKRQGRKATDGRIGSCLSDDGRTGVLVTLHCETEPVAKTAMFVSFVDQLVEIVLKEDPADQEALLACSLASGGNVNDGLTDLINQLRENICVGSFARFEGDAIAQYVHHDRKKAGMAALSGGSLADGEVGALARDLGMHIVFNKPKALIHDDLDPGFVAKEKEIRLEAIKNDPKNAKKPPEIIDKIVEGQMRKLMQELCLLEQPFVKDDKVSVEKHLKASGSGLTIDRFVYVATDL